MPADRADADRLAPRLGGFDAVLAQLGERAIRLDSECDVSRA